MYTKNEFIGLMSMRAREHQDYYASKVYSGPFPFFNRDNGDVERAQAHIVYLEHRTKTDHNHAVVVCKKDSEYYLWCGDSFLEGNKPTMAVNAAVSKIANSAKEKSEMLALTGQYPSQGCRFWKAINPQDRECSHSNHVLWMLDCGELSLDELDEKQVNVACIIKHRTPEQMLEKYQFKKHIMLQGDPGSGKTTLAENFARRSGAKIFRIGGDASVRAEDIRGQYIPATVDLGGNKDNLFSESQKGVSMAYLYGALFAAMKHARDVGPTILIFDEILRVNAVDLSVLISPLAPINGKYIFSSRKAAKIVDDAAIEEVVECPVENFWCIATTNLGAEHDVEDMGKALSDRFRKVPMDKQEDVFEHVVTESCKKAGYSEETLNKIFKFVSFYERRKADGAFQNEINQRHIKEAIETSIDEEDVPTSIWETRLAWLSDGADNRPAQEQVEELEKLIINAFM